MAGCIYCGKTGKKLCDDCTIRIKKEALRFLFPLSDSDISDISVICTQKAAPRKAVWNVSSDAANPFGSAKSPKEDNEISKTFAPEASVSLPDDSASAKSQSDEQYPLLKFPIGNYNGKGKFVFPSGDEFEGDFADGVPNGKGTYKFSNGDVYVGDFKNGKRDGFGIWHQRNGIVIYVGMWEKDKIRGKGRLYKNGKLIYSNVL